MNNKDPKNAEPSITVARPTDDGVETRLVGEDELVFEKFSVEVAMGPDSGRTIFSEGPELSIGKAPGNTLVLSDGAVSRHHCTISATPRGLMVRDLGSTNGTRIDGVRVETGFLHRKCTVSVGQTVLVVTALGEKIREPLSPQDRLGPLVGRSPVMRRLFAVLPRIALSDSTVLLEGETGTGKGLVALAIHQAGARSNGPLVVVDCGSIPPSLIESELFGHEKGAFTGAHATRIGAFEAAAGGTIFLDEVGELPLEMQPKLLRALEEREIKRVGSTERIKLDVRVIAATNRDLRTEVNRQSFRSDLYYRLNILRLRIPALRERREDIPLLIQNFYEQIANDEGAPDELISGFMHQSWPGNVRELRTAVERAVLLGDPKMYEAASGVGPIVSSQVVFDPSLPFRVAKEGAVARWERDFLADLMRRNEGNISRASRAARMDRNHLRELLRKYDLAAVKERRVHPSDEDDTEELRARAQTVS